MNAVWNQSLVAQELIAWACDQTGITWAWANQDAPQPAYPFGLMNIISGLNQIGTDEFRFDGDEKLCHYGVREFTLQIDIMVDKDANGSMLCDDNARGLMANLQASLRLLATKSRFKNANIAVIDDGQSILNLDENVADRWIGRAQMDLRFQTTTTIEEEVGYFDEFVVNSDISLPDGSQAPVQLVDHVFELSPGG